MPHFGEDEWTWERGALSTIDRPYGIFDWMHHGIGSTHVVHHVFSNLPCYNAVEATAALKKFLEPKGLYAYDDTPIMLAAWRVLCTAMSPSSWSRARTVGREDVPLRRRCEGCAVLPLIGRPGLQEIQVNSKPEVSQAHTCIQQKLAEHTDEVCHGKRRRILAQSTRNTRISYFCFCVCFGRRGRGPRPECQAATR
jgi:hypothetical protein